MRTSASAAILFLGIVALGRMSSPGKAAAQSHNSGAAPDNSRRPLVVAVISDEHEEFNPQYLGQDEALGGPLTPAHMINLVRARTPDLILVAGDMGHHSAEVEYRGFWVQAADGVASTGHATTVSIDPNPSYTEFGLTPNPTTQIFADPNGNLVTAGTWASVYDDITGANFEMVQITARTSSSVTAVFTKPHPAGFLMRAHAMSEYWDYVLAEKVLIATGNHDTEMTDAFCGAGASPCGAGAFQGPANLMNTFAPLGMFGGQKAKPYWAKRVNSLLGVVAIDTMASRYPGGDGVTYGSIQEQSLRSALNGPGLGTVWTITLQHHLPRNTCVDYGVATFALGSAVDAAFGGHTHLSQVLMAPQCIGSRCTSTKNIPVVDQSGYTWMTNDPVGACNFSAGSGYQRLVLNGSSLHGAGGPAPQRTYGILNITAEMMTFVMYDQNDSVVTDMTDPTSKATWTLYKRERQVRGR